MSEQSSELKIHIDSDWKAQAQAEKERLIEKEQKTKPAGKHADPEALPEPTFRTLIGMLASQAIMGLGAMADRESGRVIVDLDGARFNIDLLEMIETKTKGNLNADEAKDVAQVLAELRSRYVQIMNLVSKQMAAGTAAPAGAAPAPSGGKNTGPGIVIP